MSKTNESIQIITPNNFFDTLKGKFLLLDTSIFIDSSNHPDEFSKFFEECTQNEVFLTTIDAVKVEFCTGAENVTDFQDKIGYMNKIVESILPIHPKLFSSDLTDLVLE